MKCPSCDQSTSSFLRSTFSLQGVSFLKAIQGYLKCQKCGTLLRVTGFGKQLWIFFFASVLILALFVLFYHPLFSIIGVDAIVLYWVILVFLMIYVFVFGMWKYARVEKVDADTKSTTTTPT